MHRSEHQLGKKQKTGDCRFLTASGLLKSVWVECGRNRSHRVVSLLLEFERTTRALVDARAAIDAFVGVDNRYLFDVNGIRWAYLDAVLTRVALVFMNDN